MIMDDTSNSNRDHQACRSWIEVAVVAYGVGLLHHDVGLVGCLLEFNAPNAKNQL